MLPTNKLYLCNVSIFLSDFITTPFCNASVTGITIFGALQRLPNTFQCAMLMLHLQCSSDHSDEIVVACVTGKDQLLIFWMTVQQWAPKRFYIHIFNYINHLYIYIYLYMNTCTRWYIRQSNYSLPKITFSLYRRGPYCCFIVMLLNDHKLICRKPRSCIQIR